FEIASDTLATNPPVSARHTQAPANNDAPGNGVLLSEQLECDASSPTEADETDEADETVEAEDAEIIEEVEEEVIETKSQRTSTKTRQPTVHYAAPKSTLEENTRRRRERAGTLTAETPIIIERVRFE